MASNFCIIIIIILINNDYYYCCWFACDIIKKNFKLRLNMRRMMLFYSVTQVAQKKEL